MHEYAHSSFIHIPTAQNNSYYLAENLLKIHEDVLRDKWIPIAFMPIYGPEKCKRQSKGYECYSARAMRLYHDGWTRHSG